MIQSLSCAADSRPLLDISRFGGERDNGDDVSGACLETEAQGWRQKDGWAQLTAVNVNRSKQ